MTTMWKSDEAKHRIERGYERFLARVPGAHGRMLTTRFGDTHVLSAGPVDAPPLVVLHGALASSAHVMGELGSLRERFRVHAPDIIGQSVKSADARLPLDGSSCGEWLADVLDGLGLATAHVYGVSWGGFVARKLAEVAPQRIDRLVLLVPAGLVSGPAWAGLTRIAIPMALYRVLGGHERLVRCIQPLMTTLDDTWVDYLCEALESYKLDMRVPPLATAASLAGFSRPVLVFGASEDLSFPGGPLLARVKELLPHAEVELLEGCRHMPPTDDAFRERQAKRVERFLMADDRASVPVVEASPP